MISYDINAGYKKITTNNSSAALKLINYNLKEVINGNYVKSNRESYCVASHNDPFDNKKYNVAKQAKPFRKEEWMCKMCKGKTFPFVGKIVDYQVPLKHNKSDCEGMGKIDLLSKIDDTAYLLELKVPDSTEHPLRAIMEIYTYWQQLGGNDCEEFIKKSAAIGANKFKKAIVIFEKEAIDSPKYLYNKLVKDANELRYLMKELEVECFIAELENTSPNCDKIVNIRKWK